MALQGRRVCGLISGGKDSNYAFYKALREGATPACILSIRPKASDSWMFHVPLVDLTRLQAKAMGLEDRHIIAEVSGVKEKEVDELEEILREAREKWGFDTISVGALASRYQKERIERIAERIDVDVYAPLWMVDQEEYMREIVREGLRFILVKISVMGLEPDLLGKPIDEELVEVILDRARKYGFNPAFEGGEAETLVVDAPHYKMRIEVRGKPVRKGPFEWELVVEEARLTPKPGFIV